MPTKNLVSDYGAVGDGQRQTVTASITSGTGALTVGTGIFASGDAVGSKAITIWLYHPSTGGTQTYQGTITGYTSPTQITISPNITFAIPNSGDASVDILWGTDNTNAFTGVSGSWRAYARTQTNPADIPVLEIPDGNYAFNSSPAVGGALHVGVLNSARITGLSGVALNCRLMQLGGGEMRLGHDPAIVSNRGLQANTGGIAGNSVRLQTVAAGATAVTLANPAGTDLGGATYGNRIVVGRVCLIAAYDMQCTNEGEFGYPPNGYFFEWNVITGYNSGTGVVTLEKPTTQEYKSTFPRWSKETTQFAADQGGPATLWVCPDGYNNTITIENLTIDNPHNQSAIHVRHWIANNIDMNSGPGLYPTQNDTVVINNSVYQAGLEIDKMTNEVTWNNCTINRLAQQSASPNRMIINGGTINILETAKYTEANNVTFSGATRKVSLGVQAFGRTERVVLNGCTNIAEFQRFGADTLDLGGSTPVTPDNFYTFVGGVMRFLKTDNDSAGGTGQQNVTRCFMPGTWILFDDKYMDRVVDVYEDGTYCYIQFANTTNWPFTPVARLQVHPCPDITVRNCTGTARELEDLNQAPARMPWLAYSKRTYVAGATATTPIPGPFLLGKPTAIKFTVTSLFTGGTALTFNQFQFSNGRYLKQSDFSLLSNFANTINMKTGLGQTRVVANLSAGSNAQTGDTLFNFAGVGSSVWFWNNGFSSPNFSANVSNGDTPTVVVEWIMDQGIPPAVPAAVAPLRLRLRA